MLEGRSFILFTDHKPLTFALAHTTEPWTISQQRHLSFIAEYTSDIWHIAGTSNAMADLLSRLTPPTVTGFQTAGERSGKEVVTSGSVKVPSRLLPAATATGISFLAAIANVCQAAPSGGSVDYSAMAAAQAACAETQQFHLSPSLSGKEFQVEGAHLLCDTSAGAVCPLGPVAHCRLVFSTMHELANPGTRATKR